MQQIVPAIIPESFNTLKDTLNRVQSFAKSVQIDIVDGKFVPFTSWPYDNKKGADINNLRPYTEKFDIEVDLMIKEPELTLHEWTNVGVRSIVIHLESVNDIDSIFKHHEKYNYRLGLSILNTTPIEELLRYIDRIDYVQLMGIRDIGSQGQPFDESVLDRVRTLRSSFSDLLISIDGSVNGETLPRLKKAGANRFVSGSAILRSEEPETAFNELTRLSNGDI